ncbi:MAG: hypothetical protein Fur0027_15170 [Raineya sp.]
MKKNILIFGLILSTIFACKEYKTVEPTSLRETIQRLWLLKSVQVTENGLPVQDVTPYNGFTIEFVGEKYFVSNGNEAFPNREGLWGFNDPNFKTIEFDGGVIANVTKLDASELSFTFTRKGGTINGRIPDRTFTFNLVAFK